MNNRHIVENASGNTAYCGFTVGQHVVFVSDEGFAEWKARFPASASRLTFPVVGRVYTVRHIFVDPFHATISLLLVEIRNPAESWMGVTVPYENGWSADRFRPLQRLTPEQFMTSDAPVRGEAVPA